MKSRSESPLYEMRHSASDIGSDCFGRRPCGLRRVVFPQFWMQPIALLAIAKASTNGPDFVVRGGEFIVQCPLPTWKTQRI